MSEKDGNWQDEKPSFYGFAGVTFEEFLKNEGIPVHDGHYVEDVRTVEVDDWERTGGRGAIVDLEGHEDLNQVHIHEIPPGESLEEQSPVFEETVYVASGRGTTVVKNVDSDEVAMFEWGENSLFFLPRGAEYQHINQTSEPARLVVNTDAPVMFRMFKDENYVFGEDRTFESNVSRYLEDGNLTLIPGVPAVWEANFIPDLSTFDKLADYEIRGAGGTNVKFKFPDSRSLWAHVSEFPVGTYKQAHKHGPGSNVVIVSGQGFTLMWPPGESEDKLRVDWNPGTLVVPPAHWYHQHFNLSEEPARYLAMHRPNVLPQGPERLFDPKKPENVIKYVDEDPEVRRMFEEGLAERGLESQMPEECYSDPEHEFNMSYAEATEGE